MALKFDSGDLPAEVSPVDEVAALRARIAKARAATEAIKEAEAPRRELESLKLEAEQAEREVRDEEALAKAERETGDIVDRKTLMGTKGKIAAHRSAAGLVIINRPDAVKFKAFQDLEGTKREDLEALIFPCRRYPSAEEFDRILETYPATLTNLADRAAHLAGARKSELSGK